MGVEQDAVSFGTTKCLLRKGANTAVTYVVCWPICNLFMFIFIWHLMDRRIMFLFQEFIQGYDYNTQGASNVCEVQQKL